MTPTTPVSLKEKGRAMSQFIYFLAHSRNDSYKIYRIARDGTGLVQITGGGSQHVLVTVGRTCGIGN